LCLMGRLLRLTHFQLYRNESLYDYKVAEKCATIRIVGCLFMNEPFCLTDGLSCLRIAKAASRCSVYVIRTFLISSIQREKSAGLLGFKTFFETFNMHL